MRDTDHRTSTETGLPDPALRVIPMPPDANGRGFVFGGWLMAHADLAGSVAAIHRAAGPVVTRAVREFEFLAPLQIGDLVSFHAEITATGRTSVQVGLHIKTQRLSLPKPALAARAEIVYVAVDDLQKPRPLPNKS